jgi:hypothetical protein
MADLGPEASNAFKLPLFEISFLKDKKRPQTLVQILSPGGARGVCYVLPTVKKTPERMCHFPTIEFDLIKCGFLPEISQFFCLSYLRQ